MAVISLIVFAYFQNWPVADLDLKAANGPPCGYMTKKNPSGIGWKKRYWVLESDKALLNYYEANDAGVTDSLV